MTDHVFSFTLEAGEFFRGIFVATAGGFVVIKLGVRRVNNSVSFLANTEAEINIVKGDT